MVQYNLRFIHIWNITIRFLKANKERLELNWDNTNIFLENSPYDKTEKYQISFNNKNEISLSPLNPHIKEINAIEFVFRGMDKASYLELFLRESPSFWVDAHVSLVAEDAIRILDKKFTDFFTSGSIPILIGHQILTLKQH